MWNWLTSSLSVGATLVLFDGNPFHPEPGGALENGPGRKSNYLRDQRRVYCGLQNAGVKPGKEYDLTPLKAVMSTGSPFPRKGLNSSTTKSRMIYNWLPYREAPTSMDVLPVATPWARSMPASCNAGGLAMKVEALDENGTAIIDKKGELVCSAPFPSMPLYFWDDPDNRKYHSAYFDVYPNIWRHGDFIEINDRGGVVIYGRSGCHPQPRRREDRHGRHLQARGEHGGSGDSIVVGQNWKNDVAWCSSSSGART